MLIRTFGINYNKLSVGPFQPPPTFALGSSVRALSRRPLSSRFTDKAPIRPISSVMREVTANEGAQPQPSTSLEPVQIDRDAFKGSLSLLALRVPNQRCSELRGILKDHLLSKAKLRPIVQDGDSKATRLMCLSESFKTAEDLDKLPDAQKKAIEGLDAVVYTYPVDYSVFSADEVLRRLLPAGMEIPQGFETVGHIAHFNLRSELLPYKRMIAQVVLDKNPGIKTVVNKLGSIENEFRVLPMELLAGEDRLDAIVKQHGCQFHLNFAEVYWNSRLETEHRRLVDSFQVEDVVADMMGGIGPFGVPAAKHGCQVYCNDLNPRSVHWLRVNMKKNKLDASGKLGCFNLDGREFIRLLCGQVSRTRFEEMRAEGTLPERFTFPEPGVGIPFDHVVMNLPASAVEFLDVFRGVFPAATWASRPLPRVHCYTFARGEGEAARSAAIAAVEQHLGGSIAAEEAQAQAHLVRDVAPNKVMFCVSFRVPRAIGMAAAEVGHGGGVLPQKRPREPEAEATSA